MVATVLWKLCYILYWKVLMFCLYSTVHMVLHVAILYAIAIYCIVQFCERILQNIKIHRYDTFPRQQEIENQLCRPGVSYENRVSAVLSGWERLACTGEDVSQVQPLATFLYKWVDPFQYSTYLEKEKKNVTFRQYAIFFRLKITILWGNVCWMAPAAWT